MILFLEFVSKLRIKKTIILKKIWHHLFSWVIASSMTSRFCSINNPEKNMASIIFLGNCILDGNKILLNGDLKTAIDPVLAPLPSP